MSKRKINQQQQRRIIANQTKMLDTPELKGLVLAHYGTSLDLEDSAGKTIVCSKRQNLGVIVPGDNVIWQMDIENNTGVVVAVEPRTTLLSRPDARGELHAVAANVDQLFIVIAPSPAPSQTTVDRYLIAAQLQGIKPILVLNKEDLLTPDPEHQQLLKFCDQYTKLGIDTIIVSAKEKQHINLLLECLTNKISMLVGQSGVGKSSLISTLLPDQSIKIGEISTHVKQGRHTTTTARLYHLPNQTGSIIDSPGIREFPLWHMQAAELANGFLEFKPYAHECKFRNCQHINEPGCAILAAMQQGLISETRVLSYQKILAGMQNKSKH